MLPRSTRPNSSVDTQDTPIRTIASFRRLQDLSCFSLIPLKLLLSPFAYFTAVNRAAENDSSLFSGYSTHSFTTYSACWLGAARAAIVLKVRADSTSNNAMDSGMSTIAYIQARQICPSDRLLVPSERHSNKKDAGVRSATDIMVMQVNNCALNSFSSSPRLISISYALSESRLSKSANACCSFSVIKSSLIFYSFFGGRGVFIAVVLSGGLSDFRVSFECFKSLFE